MRATAADKEKIRLLLMRRPRRPGSRLPCRRVRYLAIAEAFAHNVVLLQTMRALRRPAILLLVKQSRQRMYLVPPVFLADGTPCSDGRHSDGVTPSGAKR